MSELERLVDNCFERILLTVVAEWSRHAEDSEARMVEAVCLERAIAREHVRGTLKAGALT